MSSSNPKYATNLLKDPYYLSPSDISGFQLVLDRYTGKYYINWAREVCMMLISKNKLGFITGTLPKPDVGADREDWIHVDYTVLAFAFDCANCFYDY